MFNSDDLKTTDRILGVGLSMLIYGTIAGLLIILATAIL